MTPAHIGIVACSAEGAALCYRTICQEGAAVLGGHAHPEITMHTPSLADYTARLEAGDLDGVAALMRASADILARAGADFLICPDNTIHQALPRILPASPLPWLHIADVVAEAAAAQGRRTVAVTGTRWLVESEVYPESLARHGVAALRPEAAAVREVDRIIMEELVRGRFEPRSRAYLEGVCRDLAAAGADAVALACTELPLVLSDANAGLPTLDSTRLLAQAAVARAVRPMA